MIRQAEEADLPVILEIYAYARDFMAENGNPHQWGADSRPHPCCRMTLQSTICMW